MDNAKKPAGRTVNIVVGALLVLALLGGLGFLALRGETVEPAAAVVHDGDGGTTYLPLNTDGSWEITTSFGTNTVTVENGEVYVSDADCPNQDCAAQGRISSASQQIICMPHHLWIEVTDGSEEDDAPDGLSR